MSKFLPLLALALLLTACQPVSKPSVSTSAAAVTTIPTAQTPKTTAPSDTVMTAPDAGQELVLLAPVETERPNTSYQPHFKGQTRAAGTSTSTPYSSRIITDELTSPWAIAPLPDGRLIITEKAGYLRLVSVNGQLGPPIGGLPAVDDRNQGGLLDVVPAPDFTTSRQLFLTLAEKTSLGSVTAVAHGRLNLAEDQLEDVQIIWRALPYYNNSMHFGSRLVFDQEGYLFVSTGERSDLATRPLAQQLDNGYGKIIKITKDGQPAPGNPFSGQADIWPEIYSYGHRNGQGLAIHPVTGQLWQSEMGPRGGDELNLIRPGANYGWPLISYGLEYSGQPLPGAMSARAGLEQPVYYWDPVLSPSGMTFYTSTTIAEWENNLFIAGLGSQHIARLVLDQNKVLAEERLLAKEGQRFRDITTGQDGALYAITDEGRLYQIGEALPG